MNRPQIAVKRVCC